jgi:hypothetical protein
VLFLFQDGGVANALGVDMNSCSVVADWNDGNWPALVHASLLLVGYCYSCFR